MDSCRYNLMPLSNSPVSYVTKCQYEIDDMLGKNDSFGKGFDSSGRYFTYMFSPDGIASPPWSINVEVTVHQFSDSTKELTCKSLQVSLAAKIESRTWYYPFYDAATTRWFLFEKDPEKESKGLRRYFSDQSNTYRTLSIHTGCLKQLFGQLSNTELKTTFEETEDSTIKLTYLAPDFRIISPKVMQEHNFSDGYLILVVLEHYFEHRYSIDIIKFDAKKAFHFKRIKNISPSTGLFSVYGCKTYLNLDLNMVLVMDWYNSSLFALDFNGNEYFLHNFTDSEHGRLMKFGQLKGSVFYLLYGDEELEEQDIQIVNVTENGLELKHEVHLDTYSEKTRIKRFFDEYFILELLKDPFGSGVIGFNLLDIKSGDVLMSFEDDDLDDLEFDDVSFNWDKQEIVFEIKDFDPYHVKRMVLPTTNHSLKHQARLACLRVCNDEYLKNNLPGCLQKYLGFDPLKVQVQNRGLKRDHEQADM